MNESKTAYIFIDESGTPDLNCKKGDVDYGNMPYCVYAAVVIDENDLQAARSLHAEIISREFGQGFMKSSIIRNDAKGYAKTINVLTAMKQLKHYVIALVIDKEMLQKHPGFKYKSVFIKYFQRLISKNFLDIYTNFHIKFDKTGYEEFRISLDSYMRDKAGIGPNLFSSNTFELVDDRTEEPLIQFADLYAGTIGKFYCGKYEINRANAIHDVIKSRLSIEWFPKDQISMIAATNGFDSNFDKNLYNISVDTAKQYLLEHKEDKVGCELINYILQESWRNPLRHISSKEIKENLKLKGVEIGDPIDKVSHLRGKGVVIISPRGKKGYKFPTSVQEVAEFYNRLSSNIIPQLERGHKINEVLFKKSEGKYNVLKDGTFDILHQLSKVVNKS